MSIHYMSGTVQRALCVFHLLLLYKITILGPGLPRSWGTVVTKCSRALPCCPLSAVKRAASCRICEVLIVFRSSLVSSLAFSFLVPECGILGTSEVSVLSGKVIDVLEEAKWVGEFYSLGEFLQFSFLPIRSVS